MKSFYLPSHKGSKAPTRSALSLTRTIIAFALSLWAIWFLLGHIAFRDWRGLVSRRMLYHDTLVVYVYQDTDPEHLTNLKTFIQNGMEDGDGCDYYVVVQRNDNMTELSWLPILPPNAKYLFNPFFLQDCNDMGVIGWFLQSGNVDLKNYKYFVLLSAAIRGPFLPAYVKGHMHWREPFISKLNKRVKLVGPTVQCANLQCREFGSVELNTRQNPFVQGVWVTDQKGLEILTSDTTILSCYHDKVEILCNSDMAASKAILDAGYSLDSLMLRYQGINWRNKELWDCNRLFDPNGEDWNDGVSLDPLETLFVRVEQHMVDHQNSFARKAIKYQEWSNELQRGVPKLLATNSYVVDGIDTKKAWKVVEMFVRGKDCFDYEYYRANNYDIKSWSERDLWHHFMVNGQFEGRKFKFTCNEDNDALSEKLMKLAEVSLNEPLSPPNDKVPDETPSSKADKAVV